MPTKRKSTTTTKARPRSAPLEKIKSEAWRLLGWDPRVTRYVTSEKELAEITDKNNKLFTIQHSGLTKRAVIDGFEVSEVGALGDEVTFVNTRIVKVTPVAQ